METNWNDRSALSAAEQARDSLAGDIVVPRGYDLAIGAGISAQIVTTAASVAVDNTPAHIAQALGVLALFALLGWQLARFRRANGVWISGFVNRAVLGSTLLAIVGYGGALTASIIAALHDIWWLVGLSALAGGIVYALAGRRWLRAYRRDPQRLSRGESAAWLAVLAITGAAGFVLLAVTSR